VIGRPTQLEILSRADLVQRRRAPAAPSSAPTPTVLDEIMAERRRQQTAEGWTPTHDDTHVRGELLTAARCYVTGDASWWPLARDRWKPKTRREDLIRAAALALAEVERLYRALQRYPQSTQTKALLGLGMFAAPIQALKQCQSTARALVRDLVAEIEALDQADEKDPADGQ